MAELDKPTQKAEAVFEAVANAATRAYGTKELNPKDIAYMFEKMAEGLGELAVGLRATYILLEEVRNQVRNR